MKRCLSIILLLAGLCGCFGCNQATNRIKAISHIHVENIHGGARISYRLPPGDSTQYVQATYRGSAGNIRHKRVSFYHHQLIIRDLADTNARKVQLRAVGRGGSVSKPVDIMIHPRLAAAKLVARHLTLQPTTGGLRLSLHNPTDSDLEVTILTVDSAGSAHRWHHYYSDSTRHVYLLHGWPASTKAVGVFLRDQGGVRSDTIFVGLDSLSWKGISQLKNNIFPIRFGRYDGHRWGTPAGWTTNQAARNQHGYGGVDGLFTPKGGYFSMQSWTGQGPLINGKIAQTLRLPAGRYAFDGYCWQGPFSEVNIRDSSQVFLVVAKGERLPNVDRLGSALGHASLKVRHPSVKFTLKESAQVTVGFLGYYADNMNSFRCSSVSLRRIND